MFSLLTFLKELYCNTDIAFDNLPEYYKINSNYTQINSVSYMVSGIDDEKKQYLELNMIQ